MTNLPAAMLSQARAFCSIQPCSRFVEGKLNFERDGETQQVEVCARHAEYLMQLFAGEDVGDADILAKEIVFVDDVEQDSMIDEIFKQGTFHEIVGA